MCNTLLYCKKCYHMSYRSMQIIAFVPINFEILGTERELLLEIPSTMSYSISLANFRSHATQVHVEIASLMIFYHSVCTYRYTIIIVML